MTIAPRPEGQARAVRNSGDADADLLIRSGEWRPALDGLLVEFAARIGLFREVDHEQAGVVVRQPRSSKREALRWPSAGAVRRVNDGSFKGEDIERDFARDAIFKQQLDVIAAFKAEGGAPAHVDAEIGDEIAAARFFSVAKDRVSAEQAPPWSQSRLATLSSRFGRAGLRPFSSLQFEQGGRHLDSVIKLTIGSTASKSTAIIFTNLEPG